MARSIPIMWAGQLVGYRDPGLVLRNNAANVAPTGDGIFVFSATTPAGGAYNLSVAVQPSYSAQNCTVTNGTGVLQKAAISNILVPCSSLPVPVFHAEAGLHSVTVAWTQVKQASSYALIDSSTGTCDMKSYASCPDGALLNGVTSPRTATNLRNAVAYYFRVRTTYENGAQGLTNMASARPNAPSFDGSVNAIVPGADGTVYLGGAFTHVGVTSGSGVPVDPVSGRPASADFPIVDGIVLAAVSDNVGGWYIGGAFSNVGGVVRDCLAHIRADNTVDPNWKPDVHLYNIDNLDVGAAVTALTLSSNTVYVAGSFSSIDGVKRHSLAAIATDGTLLPWDPDPLYGARTLAVSGRTVYVGGAFTTIGGVARNGLAAIDMDGTLLAWNPDLQNDSDSTFGFVSTTVNALAVSGSTVYVGGEFGSINGVPRRALAAIGTDGTLLPWRPIPKASRDCGGPGGGISCPADPIVSTLALSGNTIYVGGSFSSINDAPRNRLAAISMDGTLLPWIPSVRGATSYGGEVDSLVVSGSTVYIGGDFATVDDKPRRSLAAIDAYGTLLPWNPNPNGTVAALAITDSTVYAGGNFTALASVARNHLAALDANGALLPWNPDANGNVATLVVSGITIYAGGYFTAIGGITRAYLAAISADGTLLPWSANIEGGDPYLVGVSALAISGDTVYAGGTFTSINHVTRNYLAAIDKSGALLSWNPDANSFVTALCVADNTLYVGGGFTSIGGVTRDFLAAIGADGTIRPWNPKAFSSTDSLATVNAIAVSGSTVYVGGIFTSLSGVTRNHLAAIGVDGSLTSWDPDANQVVNALAVSDGTVFVGGIFGTIGPDTRSSLAAINTAGTLLPWNPNANSPPNLQATVDALAIVGGTVYVGGQMSSLNGTVRGGFAAIDAATGEVMP